MDLFQENVVVTANKFNVTLVSQLWLVENGIVQRDEFTEQTVFTPGLVQIATPQFHFLLFENQIQFTPACEEGQKRQLIVDRVGRFVSLLPHTPYSAVGLNFIWHYMPSGNNTVELVGRRLFFKDDTPLAEEFNSPDAKFGAYYSKNVLGFRLKLSTAPINIQRPNQPSEEVIQFSFNYHLDSQDFVEIQNALGRWDEAKRHSLELVNAVEAAI